MSEKFCPADVIDNLMEPIEVPDMGIPINGKQSKRFPDSTNVFCLEYDFNACELLIEFANGGVYRYLGVPVTVWREAQRADSIGKFVSSSIRGKYPSNKVEPVPVSTDFPEL